MCGFRVVMLPPRKITIQPTAFLEGPSDVPRRVRPRAQQATGWLQPRVGGREAAGTHLELNKAVQRGDGVGPVPSGSLGAGRWRACALGLGEWVWPDGGATSGLLGGQHTLVCHPGHLQALLAGAGPAPTPLTPRLRTSCGTQAPEASLGPHLGGEALSGPLAGGVYPRQLLRAQSRPGPRRPLRPGA